MSKASLTQFSFNRGELDPALHGRSDWKHYYSGAEKLCNLIPRTQGGITKRGGLRLVASSLEQDGPSLLVPFRFSVKQSYMLEFGDRRMRIIRDGGIVTYPGSNGKEVVIETPYPYDSLAKLRWAQTSDVMILAHPDYPPRRLTRHDHHDWRFSRLMSDSSFLAPDGLRVTMSGGDGAKYVVTAVTPENEESGPSDSVTALNGDLINMPGSDASFSNLYDWQREQDYSYIPANIAFHSFSINQLITFLIGCGYQDRGIRNSNGGRHWWHVKPNATMETAVSWWEEDYHFVIRECLYACDMGWAGNVRTQLETAMQDYVDNYNSGTPGTRITSLMWNVAERASKYRIYRERSADDETGFRLIGETDYLTFTDNNIPERTIPLPTVSDLFSNVDDYPGVCAFFEQRLILARTNNDPTTFWGSDTGLYNAFSQHTPLEDSDSYEFMLASGDMNEIVWIVPLNDMLLGTSGGEWKAGGGGSAITPSNINARVQSWYGCGSLPPIVVGRTVIFTGRSRRTIRSFSYSLEADGYAGHDLTTYAQHLFSGKEIVSMCHQQEPSGIVWVVLSDGSLLSCTFSPEEDVVAWARHETKGSFERCASLIDIDGTDQVYFCISRQIGGITKRFIEVMEHAGDQSKNESEGLFLDAGLSYHGLEVNSVNGLEHLEGEIVTCLADGNVFENLLVKDGSVTLPDKFTAAIIHAGLPYSSEAITMEMEPEAKETIRNRARFAVAATVRLYKSRECLYSHSGGVLSEMKFRVNELPGKPIRLYTGDKNIVFSTPPGTRAAKLRFVSETPTPFTLLGIIAEASYGQPA